MAADRIQRRLAAILAADVSGYSRLMGTDEQRTVADLRAARQGITDPKIAEHHGRIVNTAGDSLLVEFASVVDAVRCAVEIQRDMANHNADVPEDRRIVFRVGINVGDVIIEGSEIYGDGVNVAARLEQLASPGSVYVSAVVREQVQDKVPFAFEALGEQQVKNIARPILVSRVRWDGYAPGPATPPSRPMLRASRRTRLVLAALALVLLSAVLIGTYVLSLQYGERSAESIDDRPGIAVLPFANLSDEKDQEYFSDGLTEDLITELSRFSQLRVISRNSSFRYKGEDVDFAKIGPDLGVGYVLVGSVRRIAPRIRITGQLIDVRTGQNLWADRYEGSTQDIFATQDEISRTIASLLVRNLQDVEHRKAASKATESHSAYDLVLLGRSQIRAGSPDGFQRAVRSFQQAIAADETYADAHAALGLAYRIGALQGWGATPKSELLVGAETELTRAVALNPRNAEAHGWLGLAKIYLRKHSEGFAEVQQAYSLNPNSVTVLDDVAQGHFWMGQHDEAARLYRKVIRLDPFPAGRTLAVIARTFLHQRKFDQSVDYAKKAVASAPRFGLSYLVLAAAQVGQGRIAEAQATVAAHQALRPKFTLVTANENNPFFSTKEAEFWLSSLRQAGVPER